MTLDERRALASALKWARLNGWQYRWCGFEYGVPNAHDPEDRVQWASNERRLILRNPDRIVKMTVTSVAQALDLLVAYGLLPIHFRSPEPGGYMEWTVYRQGPDDGPGRFLGASLNRAAAAAIAAAARRDGHQVMAVVTCHGPDRRVEL